LALKIKIVMDCGKEFRLSPNDTSKTFGDFLTELTKERYYILFGDNSNKGNVCIDITKISYVEVI